MVNRWYEFNDKKISLCEPEDFKVERITFDYKTFKAHNPFNITKNDKFIFNLFYQKEDF